MRARRFVGGLGAAAIVALAFPCPSLVVYILGHLEPVSNLETLLRGFVV